jgi:hypothetical protein
VSALKGETVNPQTTEELFERSGGNPFFLTELVRLGTAGSAGVPEGVQAVIARRLSQLSEGSREMLKAAACFPNEIDLVVVAAVLELSRAEVLDRADEALAMRLLKESPDQAGLLQFSHPLLRDTVNTGLPKARRAQLHRRLAEAIEARADGRLRDETVSALAHHYSEAAVAGSVAEAARWSREAAVRDLARVAPEDARDRMVRTLDLLRRHGIQDDAIVVDLLIVLARSQRHVGSDTGRTVVSEAMKMARRLEDPGRVVEAALVLNTDTWGFTAMFGQADEELVEYLFWALPKVGWDNPAAAVAAAYVLANELIFIDGRAPGVPGVKEALPSDATGPARATALTSRAIERAREIRDRRVVLLALQSRWLAIWGPETLDERRVLIDEMQSMVSQGGLDRTRPFILAWSTALEAADRTRTDALLRSASELLPETPTPALRTMVAWRRSLRAILDARFEEAEGLIAEAYEDTARFHPREAVDPFSGQTAIIYWLQGRMHELEPILAKAIVDQPYLAPAFGPALALAQLSAGRPEESRLTLATLHLADAATAPAAMSRSGTTATLAVVAAGLGDPELVASALRFLGPTGSSSPVIIDHVGVFYMGARSAHRGRLLLAAGQTGEAVASLEEGLAVDCRMGAIPFAIKDQLDLARALTARNATGDRQRAADLLQAAHDTARVHSLVVDADRAAKLALELSKGG